MPFVRAWNKTVLSRLTLVAWTCAVACCPAARGQDTAEHSAATAPVVATLPHTSVWRFGLKITATGEVRGIQATAPVPQSWPDQKVELLSIDAPDGIDADIRECGDGSSNLYFRVSRMNAGDEVTVTATMRIEKPESNAPANPQRLVFDPATRGPLREFLTPSQNIESRDRRIRDIAESLPVDSTAPAWDQVETIYRWVRENIEYRFDEQMQSCLTALDNGVGDCEELSGVFVAICRARGIPARAVWIPEHTYPEFWLLDENGEGQWYPCQAAGSYAFGHMPEAKPILQKGDKFRVLGQRELLRYNQPAVKAADGTANPTVQWIMEQVE